MLLEHVAPLLDSIEQGRLERLAVDAEPLVNDEEVAQLAHVLVDRLVRVDLVVELGEGGRTLGHARLAGRLDLLGREHVAVEQELPHELLPVVDPQVGVLVERVPERE